MCELVASRQNVEDVIDEIVLGRRRNETAFVEKELDIVHRYRRMHLGTRNSVAPRSSEQRVRLPRRRDSVARLRARLTLDYRAIHL